MSKLAAALRAEVVRLARQDVRDEIHQLRQAVARLQAELADLRGALGTTRPASRSNAASRSAERPAVRTTAERPAMRFSAKGLKSHRNRLKLTAAELGELLGVTAQTIYNWENGKSAPGRSQMADIAWVRRARRRDIESRMATGNGG